MRKKVIFMIINMNVGGTERALLNMIEKMPEKKYDITILMLEKYGGFLNHIPERIHVKYFNGYSDLKDILNKPPKVVVMEFLKKGQFTKGMKLFYLYLVSKLTKNKSILFKYLLKDYPILNEYDVAIAYAGPMDFISYFVIHKIKAKRKIQWIHFDVTKIGFNKSFVSKIYNQIDQIFVVSSEGKRKFLELLPGVKTAVDVYTNRLSPTHLQMEASKGLGFDDDFDGVRILTVGRLSKEKGQDLVIPVLARLKNKGYKVRWYCIGIGSAKEEYEKLIDYYDVKNEFILMGSKINPYPFIKQCDIYVQPSRHEGYCMTLAEAKIFNKPIVCNDFTGAKEHIQDGETGLIVDSKEKEIEKAVEELIINVQLRNRFTKNLIHENLNLENASRSSRMNILI